MRAAEAGGVAIRSAFAFRLRVAQDRNLRDHRRDEAFGIGLRWSRALPRRSGSSVSPFRNAILAPFDRIPYSAKIAVGQRPLDEALDLILRIVVAFPDAGDMEVREESRENRSLLPPIREVVGQQHAISCTGIGT